MRCLLRRPQLALVDELEHANPPGSRHNRRYMDVEELLGAGISVYTTLNVQHIESLNDVVAQITGVVVDERIPDGVLDGADEIELIDLPPAELRQRLDEGKVYVPGRRRRAVSVFSVGGISTLCASSRCAEPPNVSTLRCATICPNAPYQVRGRQAKGCWFA